MIIIDSGLLFLGHPVQEIEKKPRKVSYPVIMKH